MARDPTGILGFDELIEGGLIPNRVYLVSGPPGSGKTTFGVQFLSYGALRGQKGIYVTLSETPKTIIEDASRYNFKVPQLLKTKKLMFLDLGPEMEYGYVDELHSLISPTSPEGGEDVAPELDAPKPAEIFKKIKSYVDANNVRRLVIDSINAIRFTSYPQARAEKEINRFIRNLKKLGCTTLLLSEMMDMDTYPPEQFASHGVFLLHNFLLGGEMTRAIQIIKMRGTKHDCNMRRLTFTPDGIRVLDVLK